MFVAIAQLITGYKALLICLLHPHGTVRLRCGLPLLVFLLPATGGGEHIRVGEVLAQGIALKALGG